MQNVKLWTVLTAFLIFNFSFLIIKAPSAQAQTCVPSDQCSADRVLSGPCPAADQVLCAAPASEAEAAGRGLQGASSLFGIVGEKAGFPAGETPPEVVVGRIVQGLMLLIGVVFGILVVYGGYLWMIARGNEEYVKEAIRILEAAAIGFVIVLGAYAVTSYIVERVILAAYQQDVEQAP